jgi:hypothetical protein
MNYTGTKKEVFSMKNAIKKFGIIALVAVIVFSMVAFSGSESNDGNIPDGTYYSVTTDRIYYRFSGNMLYTRNVPDLWSECRFTVRDGDLIIYDEKYDHAEIYKYILDGDRLIIFNKFYINGSEKSNRGSVYVKK